MHAPREAANRIDTMPTLLHVGCGRNRKDRTTPGFAGPEWAELRLDIDPGAEPDIVGSMLDLSAVADGSVDAVFSAHSLEHLHAHEVPLALREFLRVLRPDGFAVLIVPDLQSVAQLVAEDRLDEPAYVSPAGPIAPLDILYGHRAQIAAGNAFMAHKCGFTLKTLLEALRVAGFRTLAGARQPAPVFELWVIACKGPESQERMRALAAAHFGA
jgi:SAM-dependent methyltransferase